MEKESIYKSIVNESGIEILYDEDCTQNDEEGEWSIPSKIYRLEV